jgi:NADH-quinone oxidoreductase subunit N
MNTILVLSCLGLATLFAGVYKLRKLVLPLVIAGVLAAFAINYLDWNIFESVGADRVPYAKYLNGMLTFDHFAVAFSGLLCVLTIVIFFLCDQHYSQEDSHIADIYALILFTLVGGIMMTSYSHLAMLFIGIETLSIPLYILASSRKLSLSSNEAGLKYFLMGSFSTGFLLFGIALMYGITGSFHLADIHAYVVTYAGNHPNESMPIMFKAGMFLMLVGMFFKVSAFPFHFWAPDVYEGSPSLITTFMATVVKTAGFAALYRLMSYCFGGILHEWFYTIWAVTALTITFGNLAALYQKNVKRMLAYSSLSNAGYLLITVLSLNENSASALFYYTAAYSLSTIIAFAVLMRVEQAKRDTTYESFSGLAKNNPMLAGLMTLALLSLAGIPPLAGFFGKYFLFATAIENNYVWIVIIAVLNSLAGIYYYFKVIVSMFTGEAATEKLELKPSYLFVLLLAAAGVVVLGLFPGLITHILS